jgi:hypothetical protein
VELAGLFYAKRVNKIRTTLGNAKLMNFALFGGERDSAVARVSCMLVYGSGVTIRGNIGLGQDAASMASGCIAPHPDALVREERRKRVPAAAEGCIWGRYKREGRGSSPRNTSAGAFDNGNQSAPHHAGPDH